MNFYPLYLTLAVMEWLDFCRIKADNSLCRIVADADGDDDAINGDLDQDDECKCELARECMCEATVKRTCDSESLTLKCKEMTSIKDKIDVARAIFEYYKLIDKIDELWIVNTFDFTANKFKKYRKELSNMGEFVLIPDLSIATGNNNISAGLTVAYDLTHRTLYIQQITDNKLLFYKMNNIPYNYQNKYADLIMYERGITLHVIRFYKAPYERHNVIFTVDYKDKYETMYESGLQIMYNQTNRTNLFADSSYLSIEFDLVSSFVRKYFTTYKIINVIKDCWNLISGDEFPENGEIDIFECYWDDQSINIFKELSEYQDAPEEKIAYVARDSQCVICKEKPSIYLINRCGHLLYCDDCVKSDEVKNFCAICNKKFNTSQFIRLYIP